MTKFGAMSIAGKINSLIFLIFFSISSYGQESTNLGIPHILNFTKQEYGAGIQNWDFTQDQNGVIFAANNEGLLSYDGTHWQLYPLPNKTIVRSVVAHNEEGRIYVGGQDEIGYFQKDEHGFLAYHSIKSKIPKKYRELADIWTLFEKEKQVYFISTNTIYCYTEDTVMVHPQTGAFPFLGKGEKTIVTQDTNGTIYTIEKDFNLSRIGQLPYELASIFEDGEEILMATVKNGLFSYSPDTGVRSWEGPTNSFLKDNRITRIKGLKNGFLAIGTALGGVVVLSKEGIPIYWIDKKAGLENNTIRSVYVDGNNNLWLGLDNGIAYISIADPVTFFYPDGALEGTSYAIEIFENNIYIGTTNGLYQNSWKSYYNPLRSRSSFQKIPGSEGQVWGLNIVNNELFLGHHEGAFIVENQDLRKINSDQGFWLFLADPADSSRILAGTYNGLYLIEKNENSNWEGKYNYDGFNESSRFVVSTTNGDFWISHPYRGVFKVRNDKSSKKLDVKAYGKQDGLPFNIGNHAFHIWGKTIVCSEKGIFEYVPSTDRFQPYEDLNNIFGSDTKVRRLFEDQQGNLWYITQEKIGCLKIEDQGLQKEVKNHELPGLHNQLMGGFELIYPHDSTNVFLGSEKGMIHINPGEIFDREYHFKTILKEIHLIKESDSLIFANQINGNNPDSSLLELSNRENSLRFLFSSTSFSPFQNISYQYQLQGFDEDWSSWSQNNSREYTNLPPGHYTFKVRSGIPDIYTSNTAYFSFYIQHPWYATPLAYGIYAFLILLGIAGLIWVPRKQFEKEKALIEQEKEQKVAFHQEEVRQSKEELMAVRNEKLNAEIEHKNRELASTTMHLLQKNELIQKLKTEVNRLRNYADGPEARKEFKRIMGLLNDDTHLDEEWEHFFFHFDQVHSDFFKRLKEKYPQLTPKDQKMCAYLRMNLSTKEIAPLMNISVRGVEISRYRLRKKLDLDTEVNLNEFMMEF